MNKETTYVNLIKLRVDISRVRRLLDTILANGSNNELLAELKLEYDINTSYNRLHSLEKTLRNKISELDKEIKK